MPNGSPGCRGRDCTRMLRMSCSERRKEPGDSIVLHCICLNRMPLNSFKV
jgi:hypothetical protein